MTDFLKQYKDDLSNADAGWVTRRDAAEALGAIAAEALAHLRAHRKDDDRDVRDAVRSAFGEASASVRGVEPVVSSRKYSLEDLVRAAEKPETRIVEANGAGGFKVTVHLKDERKQVVMIDPHRRKDGTQLVSVFTPCGPAEESAYRWALENNLNLNNCAMAIKQDGDRSLFVLERTMRQEFLVPEEMKAAIKEIAYYGDWIEGKLTGQDEF